MENATKALLIAGSVLIALLLIAVGIRIFNSTQGTVDSSQKTMDATEIAFFNTQFTEYLNKLIPAHKVNSLEQKIIASNAVYKGKHYVDFENKGAGIYRPSYDTNGYINSIDLED